MLVKFTTNIGMADARLLSIDHKGCREGMTCEVGEREANWLFDHNLAVDVTPPAKPNPAKVEPKPDDKPEPKPVEAKAETTKPSK